MAVEEVDNVLDVPQSVSASHPRYSPAAGCAAMNARGSRVLHRVNRAFVALGDQLVATGTLVRMVWPRRSWFRPWHYQRAKRAAVELGAEVVGHERRGRFSRSPGGLLWKLKSGGR
jgi:hypothetical protein